MGSAGGAAPRPPRPPRPPPPRPPPRPAASVAAAGAAGGGGAGARAAISGERSASLDQRNTSIVSGTSVVPTPTARSVSTGSAAAAGNTRASAIRNAPAVLLPITVVRTLRAAQPLDEPLQFIVGELGAAPPHVNRDDAPPLGREPRVVDTVDPVARGGTRPLQERLCFGVREKGRYFLRDVRARERLGGRPEPHLQPVEKNGSILIRKRDLESLVLRGEQLVPTRAVQRVVGVVVDAVAGGAVLEDHLPDGALRRHDRRARRPAAQLRGDGCGQRSNHRCDTHPERHPETPRHRDNTSCLSASVPRCVVTGNHPHTISSGCSRPVLVPILSISIP